MAFRLACLTLGLLALGACGGHGSKSVDAPPPGDGRAADSSSSTDSSVAGDAMRDAPNGATVGTTCGSATCNTTQVCCVGAGGQSSCVAPGSCQGVSFACDGPEDCSNNDVCCYSASGSGGGGATCEAANACQTTACHTDADCGGQTPSCCPLAQTGYMLCEAHCI
jgi:hypothetical protein